MSYTLSITQNLMMASSLANLVNKLFEGIRKIKYKYGHNDKKYETFQI